MEQNNTFSAAIALLQEIKEAIYSEERVMTCSEAAFRLKITPQTVSRYIEQGKLHRASGNGVNGVRASEVFKLMVK